MNALRTASFRASRAFRLFLTAIILALAGLSASPAVSASSDGSGQALALQAAMRAAQAHSVGQTSAIGQALAMGQRTPSGRTLTDLHQMRSGVIRRKSVTTSSTVPVPGGVQTFDIFNPPPSFQPLDGYGDISAPNSNTANPPIYLTNLSPVNLTPVWSQDESFIVFSSNRTLAGGLQPDGRFHLWAISVNGGEAFQITTSTGAVGGGEFFPAMSSSDNRIVFTSDAQTPGHQNLYAIPFSYSVLSASNNAGGSAIDIGDNTMVQPYTNPNNTSANFTATGFDQIQRPTISPGNNDLVVFSAHSVTGTYAGHNHIYYLYLGTDGYNPNIISLPAKLTDGPANDTDPAFSQDGQFIAFASTATQLINQPSASSSNPNTSQSLTQAPDPGGLRNIFLISGGSSTVTSPGFGLVPTQLQSAPYYGRITTAANEDNYGPAWSSVSYNQYTNQAPGFEYIAFARGSSPTTAHDIYYIQAVRSTNQAGESAKSDEVATTPEPASTPIYQINAGGGRVTDNLGNSYQSEAYTQTNLAQAVTLNIGGTAGPTNITPNLTNDPGTPAAIYTTARTGVFGYSFPNLTPGARYTVRFHFADPTSTAAGQREFNVFVNQNTFLSNFDIYAQAQVTTHTLGGLVSDSNGNPLGNATVTVTNLQTNTVAATTTTSAFTNASSDGGFQNYSTASLPNGSYSVAVTLAGYTTITQTVSISGPNFTRQDFTLTPTTSNGTLTGTVTDASSNAVAAATLTVRDVNTGAAITTNPTPLTSNANTGAYSTSLPPGTYYVTATPANGSGEAPQTQQVVITAAATTTTNFTLASGTGAGTLAGLVTDSVTNTPIAGGTVTITQGGVFVTTLTTSGTATTTGPLPTGDNATANYSTVLPVGTYTLKFSAPGYTSKTVSATVLSSGFTRSNNTLVIPISTGTTPVVVESTTAIASATGTITIAFTNSLSTTTPVAPIGTPIVEGVEVLASSVATQSSGFGGYEAATKTTGPTDITAIGGNGQVTLSFNAPAGFSPISFNIYRSPVTNASVTSINQPGAGTQTEGNIPYYTNVPFDPTVIGPTTFVDGITTGTNVTDGVEYYYQVTAVYQEQIAPEGIIIPSSNVTPFHNAAIHLNTDDNGAPNAVPANSFDDVYPTWSPLQSIFSIAYESGSVQNVNPLTGTVAGGVIFGGRTVTYNNPTTGFPSETAFSVGAGGSVTSTTATTEYTVAATYTGIFESQLLNLDPPTLLRFSDDEVVHIQSPGTNPVTGTEAKTSINPGQPVTITVRLSDREAGIDDGNSGLNSGGADATKPQVFVQIKDPDSKYQDSQNLEHKLFARDSFYNGQINQPANDVASGSANDDLSIDGPIPGQVYPTYPDNDSVSPRGALGGFYDSTGVNIFVGKTGGGKNKNKTSTGLAVPGDDPAQFIAWGPEYECQFLNPQFSIGTGQNAPTDTSQIDYATPYYLAGVDDQLPFSGQGMQRPTTNGTKVVNGSSVPTPTPAEWLQLSRVPDAQQDHLGGVLYTVTWTTPTSGSDYYLDVIAFDKAAFPNFPPQTTNIISNGNVATNNFIGQKVNWRIYDNVGGFSTNPSIGNNDILVVSDYSLGQKFAATTFGGTNGNLNLVPKLYGAEAAITDVDVNILPDTVYAGYPTDADSAQPSSPPNIPFAPALFPMSTSVPWLNGLGVGSYSDGIINDGGVVDGSHYVQSQKYSIWRILARGPIPQSILNTYLPTQQQQPAVQDAQSTSAVYRNIPAATVLDARRCVIWISPYTGDLLSDPGTIDDPGAFNRPNAPDRQSTQTILRTFVQGGGRLFVTGQDVGSTLTSGGTVANAAGGFLSDVLNATLLSTGGGTNKLAATSNRITGYPEYDGSGGNYPVVTGAIPNQGIAGGGGEPYNSRLELGDSSQSDGSLSQRPAFTLDNASLQGQPDTLTPTNGALTALTYSNGAVAMVFHDDPYDPTGTGVLPNGGTGGRVVYAGFGLEALSNDAYSSDGSNATLPYETIFPLVAPRNPRSNILHNIVCYLRTGGISGLITQTSGTGPGAGQGIPGVTVYLVPASGVAPPSRVTFSAITASDGHFNILGVEPGTYTLAAYKAGYTHAVSNNGVSFTVEGDLNVGGATLTMTPLPPGSIAGNVHDTAGKPVINATVSFLSQDNTIVKSTTTFDGLTPGQPAGNYLLPSVPVTTYTGTATGPNNPNGNPEYLPATSPDTPYKTSINVLSNTTVGDGTTQGGPPVAFTLTPIPASISGRIYDITVGDTAAGGANVTGAVVALTDSTGKPVVNAAGTAITAAAGADGTYTLSGIPAAQTPTTYTITVTKAGYSPGTFTQVVYLGDILTGKDKGLTPILPGTITGTVKDQSGVGVVGATVTFTSPDGTVKTILTGANGAFTLTGVPPGTYSATALGPNNPNGRPTSSTTATTSVVVVTAATAGPVNLVVTIIPPSFAGKVTDATTGAALAGAAVTVTDSATGALIGSTLSGADGTYSTPTAFTIPPGGTYIVTASLAGYSSVVLVNTATNGTTFTEYNGDALTNQNFALTKIQPGSLTGVVTDTANNPISGATVTFVSADKTQTYTATTSASGTYTISTVQSATYFGTAAGSNNAAGNPEYLVSASQTATVSPGQQVKVNFALTPILPTVTGTVTDATTLAALGNVTVTFTPTAGGTPVIVTTNASGVYASGSLPVGAYTVTAAAITGYFVSTQTVTVGLGDITTLNFALNRKATLIGDVTDATTGLPIPGVTLTVNDAATGAAIITIPATLVTTTITTGADGSPINYLGSIPPGTYTVTASKSGYDSKTSPSAIFTNGPFTRVDIKLLSSIGTLGGLVTDSTGTTALGGATVTVTNTTGNVVATFTTSASSSAPAAPNGDSSPLNYSGQVAKGTYTVTVTKAARTSAAKTVTVLGGQFNRLDFTGTTGGVLPLYTFPAGLNFLSTPYDYSASSFDTLFGNLNTAATGTTPNGNRSHVAVWNPVTAAYAVDPTFPADVFRLGVGYWVFLKNPVSFTVQGASPTTATVPVTLHPFWNQIGVPNPNGVKVSALLFDSGTGGTISFATAVSAQYNVVSPTLYRYDGASYQPVTAGDTLQPYQAYWIKANVDATLEIPTQ